MTGIASRYQRIRVIPPHIVADVVTYPTSDGERRTAAIAGWGCPCCVSKNQPIVGYDGFPLLETEPLEPETRRRLGFVFLSGEEAAEKMRKARSFYLWAGGFIGEATVIEEPTAQ